MFLKTIETVRAAKTVELSSTTIGFGLGFRYEIDRSYQWGILASGHSDNLQEQHRYRHVIRQQAQLLLAYGRYLPSTSSAFFLQAGIARRSQQHETLYRRDVQNGDCPCGGMGSIRVDWPQWALQVGFGWDWGEPRGLHGGLGFGWIYSAPPKLSLDTQQTFGTNTPDQDAYLAEEWRAMPSRTKHLRVWPLYSISLGWSF